MLFIDRPSTFFFVLIAPILYFGICEQACQSLIESPTTVNRLKALSSGYASFDYEKIESQEVSLCCLTVLVNKEPVDAFSVIVPKIKMEETSRELATKLKENIDRFACVFEGIKKGA